MTQCQMIRVLAFVKIDPSAPQKILIMLLLNFPPRSGLTHTLIHCALATLALCSVASRAEESPVASSPVTSEKIATDVLVAPTLLPLTNEYPEAARRHNREGWVQLGMMVDTSGKPYEVTVISSSGDKTFEQAALRAVDTTAKFTPGMLNGKPIDSAYQFKMNFLLTGLGAGASEVFAKEYAKFARAVQRKDRPAAEAAIGALVVQNLYEDSYYGLAQYQFAREWGSKEEELRGLRRAIALESTTNYLSKADFQNVLTRCFVLELQQHDYAQADETWRKLKNSGVDISIEAKLEPAVAQMHQLQTSNLSYDIKDSMPDGSWNLNLYKQNFRISVTLGQIHDVKLRCNRGFVRFNYDPALQYKVQSRYGACAIELDGDPGTRFTLTQF